MAKIFSELKKTSDKDITFKISNLDLSFVNGLRRILIAEIETICFDFNPLAVNEDIVFTTNTSGLHNEFLGHRISLIPLHFTRDEIKNYTRNSYKFVLKKKNTSINKYKLTTEDFVIYDKDDKLMDSSFTNRIFPANSLTGDKILINILRSNLYDPEMGEEVDVECRASVATGQKHARWSPVSLSAFENVIDDEKAEKVFEEKSKDMTTEEKTSFRKQFNTLERQRYYKTNKYGEPREFLFKIESITALSGKELFDEGMEVLEKKLTKWIDNLVDIDMETDGRFYYAFFKNEDHTLGSLLQSNMYNMSIKNKEIKNFDLSFIGYNKNHPLDSIMGLKFKFDNNMTNDRVRDYIKIVMEELVNKTKQLREEWNKL